MSNLSRGVPLLGRLLLALIFVLAGITKLAHPAPTVALMGSHGIPLPQILVFGAIAVELVGGAMLMLGFYGRVVALVLFCYTLILAFVFHAYWAAPAAQEAAQHALFFGHLSMMGGMLYVAAFGSGPLSVDEALLSHRAPNDLGLKTR